MPFSIYTFLDFITCFIAGTNCFSYTCSSFSGTDVYEVVITEKGAPASTNAIVTVTNNTSYDYQLQSFTYAGAPSDYKVIENGEIVPGESIFGAIVISADTPVSVVVNDTSTSINIPNGGVVFYCFAVKTGGNFNVVINPA